MCGICGIVNFMEPPQEKILWDMIHELNHRGPDDHGIYVAGAAGLGHTRLSILDLSPTGYQPMLSEDNNTALVYNGEIYNFQEIRTHLEQDGSIFRGSSDTEVVLRGYMRWGTEVFTRFKGMFAFALWDQTKGHLHLVRDRFGIKPLYYFPFGSGIIFGSEIKALLASKLVPHQLNQHILHEYLYYGAALGKHSFFKGVYRLSPGHVLTLNRSGLTIEPYAQFQKISRMSNNNRTKAISNVRHLLENAVKSHLVSDVPVGIFLSGGLDSSAITAFASRHYSEKIQTFSVGFDFDNGINELPNARIVAQHFGTEHHELHISGYTLSDTVERLIEAHDEPFADAANIPLYLLCEQLQGSLKVILQGDGGDEIFAGYRRYHILSNERMWRWGSILGSQLLKGLPHLQKIRRIRRLFYALRQKEPALRMALLLTMDSPENPPTRVLSMEWRQLVSQYDPFARYHEIYSRLPSLDPVQQMLYTDTQIILPDIFLEKVDKSTMAKSIEIRVPMLDQDLTQYVMGLPSTYKVWNGTTKWILRQALQGILPDAILNARKIGFGTPYGYWLRKPLAGYLTSVLFDHSMRKEQMFDYHVLKRLIDEHLKRKCDHGFLLWKILHLALWFRKYRVTQ